MFLARYSRFAAEERLALRRLDPVGLHDADAGEVLLRDGVQLSPAAPARRGSGGGRTARRSTSPAAIAGIGSRDQSVSAGSRESIIPIAITKVKRVLASCMIPGPITMRTDSMSEVARLIRSPVR